MLTSRQTKDEGAQLHATAERYKYCWHMMHVGSFKEDKVNFVKKHSRPKISRSKIKVKVPLLCPHIQVSYEAAWEKN